MVHVERQRRSPDARRFGGVPIRASRGYSRRASLRAQRPRPGTKPKPCGGPRPNTKPKQRPPHVKTVLTKDGKKVHVNNNQAYMSSKIPPGAIAIKQPGSRKTCRRSSIVTFEQSAAIVIIVGRVKASRILQSEAWKFARIREQEKETFRSQ